MSVSRETVRAETMAWRAVRSRNWPAMVLGFLQVPANCLEFRARDHDGFEHRFELRTAKEARVDGLLEEQYITFDLSVYSENRGIDFWRTIPGFLAVTYG